MRLDRAGSLGADGLLIALNQNGNSRTLDQYKHIVATSDNKRSALSDDGLLIRACQGRSVEADLPCAPQTPPEVLYHGTATRLLDPIRLHAPQKLERHDVHVSAGTKVTLQAGGRRGKPAPLRIRAATRDF